MEMAAYFPQNQASLYQIHGVGETKLSTYGAAFLDVIRAYCRKLGISEKSKPTTKPVRKPTAAGEKADKKKRHEVIAETFNAGRSVMEIMEMFNIKRQTVVDHLYRFWCEGNSLASDHLGVELDLSKQQTDATFTSFEKHGVRRMKPVFDALAGEVDYPDLSVLRLMFIAQNGLMADR
jgi:ATP-dependent DNA helicase RecQ